MMILVLHAPFEDAKENVRYLGNGLTWLGERGGERAAWGAGQNCIITLRRMIDTKSELCLDPFKRTPPDWDAQCAWNDLGDALADRKLTPRFEQLSAHDLADFPTDEALESAPSLPTKEIWKARKRHELYAAQLGVQWSQSIEPGKAEGEFKQKSGDGYGPSPESIERHMESEYLEQSAAAQRRENEILNEKHWRSELAALTPKDAAEKWLAVALPEAKPNADENGNHETMVLQLGKPGRPRDKNYNLAANRINSGESPKEAFAWFCAEEKVQKPDKGLRDAFRAAMKRRQNNS